MSLSSDQDTPYHQITKPAFEKDPWDEDYYALLDKLDTELILKDTVANRPSSPPSDSWFLATDEDILYYYDGSWRVIAGSDIQSSSDISHDQTSGGTVSDAHHSKTTSQNDLTDFSFNGENITVSSSEPSNPTTNDLWVDTS